MTNTPPPPQMNTINVVGINQLSIKDREVILTYQLNMVKQIRYIGAAPAGNGKKRKNSKRALLSTSVPLGCLAVVTHGNAVYDHDGYPEVYLPGELIVRRNLTQENEWRIIEIAFYPGYFELAFEKPLYSLVQGLPEMAKALFNFGLYVEDPVKLLANHSNWDTAEGNQYLIQRVVQVIAQSVENYIQGEIQVWSVADVNSVAEGLLAFLNSKLVSWGLKMRPDFTAVRKFPDSISRIIFAFRQAEIELLEENARALHELDVPDEAIVKIQIDARQFGVGAGLFNYLAANLGQSAAFDRFFAARMDEYTVIVDYLRYARAARANSQELSLVNQILRSYFLHPNLSVGEWLEK